MQMQQKAMEEIKGKGASQIAEHLEKSTQEMAITEKEASLALVIHASHQCILGSGALLCTPLWSFFAC